jgi:hypothetical protein
MGLANASACLTDQWAAFNNIAGLAELDHASVSASYLSHPYLKSFNSAAAVIALPVYIGTAGFGFYRFGDDLFSHQSLSATIANKFGLASLGVRANLIQYSAEGYGTRSVVTVSFGGIAELTPVIDVGAYITNINQPEITIDGKETVPTLVTLGVGIKASENVLFLTEVEKDLDYSLTTKCALEYQFKKKFFLRCGFKLNPDIACLGTGFLGRRLAVDLAVSYHLRFGINTQATVSYNFKKQ